MKIALITTTINVPSVLALYRRFDPSAAVRFFVAIDRGTPLEVRQFLDNLGNCQLIFDTDYKCDKVIGYKSIQRRNLALLEALRWGADIIISCDDDNAPLDPNYFFQFASMFESQARNVYDPGIVDRTSRLFSGLQVGGNEWFDVGTLLTPPATHRGFPVQRAGWAEFSHVIDVRIGVAAGMVLGDPDTSAVERIANHPKVHGVSEVLRAGLVVDPATHTVFNSQNTAFIRELAPAMMMFPGVGRYDDIFASLLCQRVMRDRDLLVHFGRPFVYQQRNDHNLVNDLKAEIFGMEHIVRFAEWLDLIDIPKMIQGPVLPTVRAIYQHMAKLDWMPPIASECGLAWCEDCEDCERVVG